MPGMEEAAAVFDADMGSATPAPKNDPAPPVSERMFNGIGDLEVDDNSPARGAGDDLPNEGEVNTPTKTKAPKEERELTEDEILYGDDPDDPSKPKPEEEPGEDDAEEDEEPDEDGEPAEVDRDAEVEIMVDGQPQKVKLGEALDGYIRQETFHQRLNQVNEARQEVITAGQTVVANYQKAVDMIDELGTALSSLVPAEPDWDKEFAADPARARKLQKDYEGLKAQLGGLAARRAEILEEQTKIANQNRANFAAAEQAKIDKSNPHWADPVKKEKDLKSMVRTAKAVGFSDQEIAGVLDSRMIAILLKASRYDRMMAARPKAKTVGKTPATPGTGAKRTVRRGIAKSQQSLARTGSVEDAANVMQHLLR